MAAVIDDSVTVDLGTTEPPFALTPLQILLIGGAVAAAALAIGISLR